jgi:hypothetical protein
MVYYLNSVELDSSDEINRNEIQWYQGNVRNEYGYSEKISFKEPATKGITG